MYRAYRRRSPRRELDLRPVALLLLLAAIIFPFLHRDAPKNPLPDKMVELALSQVGKVPYFWGGKSERMGPDPRWGMLTRVTSEGSDTTGTLLPYGLDCSGLISWAAVNAAETVKAYDMMGEGVRAQYANCSAVPWEDARPGDLTFFPDLSHVGVVVGKNADGTLRVVHSSKTYGGVVLSEDAALIGFTSVGRPNLYNRFKSLSG